MRSSGSQIVQKFTNDLNISTDQEGDNKLHIERPEARDLCTPGQAVQLVYIHWKIFSGVLLVSGGEQLIWRASKVTAQSAERADGLRSLHIRQPYKGKGKGKVKGKVHPVTGHEGPEEE